MTQLFAQVIPGLGSLSGFSPVTIPGDTQMSQPAALTEQVQYTAIPLEGSTMVSIGLFPGKQVRSDGTAAHPIYLGNDTDSRISSIGHSSPVKTPGSKRQSLASTPKTKPKLLVTAQQQQNELVAIRQGAPHGAHIWPFHQEASWTHPWGSDLFGWKSAINPGASGNSSFVSVEEHTQLTTTALMQRDAPHRTVSGKDDVVSIHEDPHSDVKMVSNIEHPEQHTEDSSVDSAVEHSDHSSDDSEMESDQDRGSDHHLDSGSDNNPNPRSNLGSATRSSSSSESSSDFSDKDRGDFADMFQEKEKHSNTPKKPGLWKHSEATIQ